MSDQPVQLTPYPGNQNDKSLFYLLPAAPTASRNSLMCTSPKVGITSFQELERRNVTRQQTWADASALLSTKATIKAAMVRAPTARFESYYRNKLIDNLMTCPLLQQHGSRHRCGLQPGKCGLCHQAAVSAGITNSRLLGVGQHDCRPRSPTTYALALAAHARKERHYIREHIDPHLRSQTRHCALDSVRWDVAGSLQDSDAFAARVGELGGLHFRLGHANRGNRTVAMANPDATKLISCAAGAALRFAYRDDLVHIARMFGEPPPTEDADASCSDSAALLEFEAIVDEAVLLPCSRFHCKNRCCCFGPEVNDTARERLFELIRHIPPARPRGAARGGGMT